MVIIRFTSYPNHLVEILGHQLGHADGICILPKPSYTSSSKTSFRALLALGLTSTHSLAALQAPPSSYLHPLPSKTLLARLVYLRFGMT